MSKKPNLSELLPLFEAQSDFSLTETQYTEKTGAALPKDSYYLLKKSAVAKAAMGKGYEILLNERTILFKKINKGE